MGTPIKERGIRWVESYGDKSSYLKTQMEKQVGPGGYFRWEGHDATTGNDYYVVVSPGYSSKHGYHFFAGLRKMPADHGASGKKFKNMRSALFYAYDTWRVPKPDSLPAAWTGYNVDDIAGKAIVLEGVHASSEKQIKTAGIIIYSPNASKEIEQESMAVQTMEGGLSSHRTGHQLLAKDLCYAYRAAPVMGFLPAYYSQSRMIGLDGMNFNRQLAANTQNKISQDAEVPISPLVATCQQPSDDEFNTKFEQGNVVSEKLYTMPGQFDRQQNQYATFKKPYTSQTPDDDVKYKTWGDISTVASLEIPAQIAHVASPILNFWKKTLGIDEKTKQKAVSTKKSYYTMTVDKSNIDDYDEFIQRITALVQEKWGKSSKPNISFDSTNGKNFVRLYLRAKQIRNENPVLAKELGVSAGFDFNQPCEQQIRQRGSQMLDYDTNGMPMKLIVQTPDKKYEEEDQESEGGDGQRIYYVINNPVSLVSKNVTGDFATAWKKRDQTQVFSMLSEFHKKAANNQVQISASEVTDHRTAPRLAVNPMVNLPKLNNFKLPVDNDGKLLSPDKIGSLEDIPTHDVKMITGSTVQANKIGNEGYAARWFDREANNGNGGYVYDNLANLGKLRKPVTYQDHGSGMQKLDGAPASVQYSMMYRPGPIGFQAKETGTDKVSLTFDGKPSDGDISSLANSGFRLTRLTHPPFFKWSGNKTKLPPQFKSMHGEVNGFYTIQRGETDIFDTNGAGKVISGNANDVVLGPVLNELTSPGAPTGITISYVPHKAKYEPENEFKNKPLFDVRQQGGALAFTESVPGEEEIPSEEGDVFDATYVTKSEKGGKVMWQDSLPALRYLKNKLKIDDNLAYPFSRTTTMDRKVIKDRETMGRKCYEQYAETPEDVPDEIKDLFEYGRVVSQCSLEGETVPKEVWKAFAEAMKDPQVALKPKEVGKDNRDGLLALLVVPKGVTVEQANRERDKYLWGSQNYVVDKLRGSQVILAPDYKKYGADYDLNEISFLFPGVDALGADFQMTIVNYSHESGKRFSQPSMAVRSGEPKVVYGQEHLLKSMNITPTETIAQEEKEMDVEIADAPPAEDEAGNPVREDDIGLKGEVPETKPETKPETMKPETMEPEPQTMPVEPTSSTGPTQWPTQDQMPSEEIPEVTEVPQATTKPDQQVTPYIESMEPVDVVDESESDPFIEKTKVPIRRPNKKYLDFSKEKWSWHEKTIEKLAEMSAQARKSGKLQKTAQMSRAIKRLMIQKDSIYN